MQSTPLSLCFSFHSYCIEFYVIWKHGTVQLPVYTLLDIRRDKRPTNQHDCAPISRKCILPSDKAMCCLNAKTPCSRPKNFSSSRNHHRVMIRTEWDWQWSLQFNLLPATCYEMQVLQLLYVCYYFFVYLARLPKRYCFCIPLRCCKFRFSAEMQSVHRLLFGSVPVIQYSPVTIQCIATANCNVHFNSLFTSHTVSGAIQLHKKILF